MKRNDQLFDRDGGPAFPVPIGGDADWSITKRDYFATAAIVGAIGYSTTAPELLAEQAYRIADAMLKERSK